MKMKVIEDLYEGLDRIDGKGYKAYKDIKGGYDAGQFQLFIDHVQGDPFAAPSRVRVRLKHDFPSWTHENKRRNKALSDLITRTFGVNIGKTVKGGRGSGKSGELIIDRPAQEVLERTSVVIEGEWLEVRFKVGLPAFGRKVAGKQAKVIFREELPILVDRSLYFGSYSKERVEDHIQTIEDAEELRQTLDQEGLVGFVANGAILPRASGVDPRPLKDAVPFQSPSSLEVEIPLKNRTVKGMGVPKGITLIVGGGYHGKSTLLNALELGVYDHIPGDGREFVVSVQDAAKIRAEDGRSIENVDISPFINDLPHGKDTTGFSSENASGSTSQAANTMEALEAGSTCLLIDEDTSATNFMIRDDRMQELVPKDREPITPYIDKAQQLYDEQGISTVLVIGGSGAYFDVADTVVCMVEYLPQDLTSRAKEIAGMKRNERVAEGGGEFGNFQNRIPIATTMDPTKGKKVKVRAHGTRELEFGTDRIDLSSVEQLIDPSQTRAIGDAILYAKERMDGHSLKEILDGIHQKVEDGGLDVLNKKKTGENAGFRRLELAATINRMRRVSMKRS